MLYYYKAKTVQGDLVSGEIEAGSTVLAQQDLRRQGKLILSITANRGGNLAAYGRKLKRTSKVPKSELLLLTSQLAIMCETGVDLAEALEESAAQATNPVLRRALKNVHQDISEGKPIAEAMNRQVDVFGSTYVASVVAGESSGKMAEVLNRLTELLNAEIQLKSMLKSAAAYPAVLAGISCITLMVLLLFVLPRFGEIFADLNVDLPFTTEWLLALSGSLRQFPLLWLTAALLAVGGGVFAFRHPITKRKIDYLVLNAKGVRDLTRSIIVGRAFRLVGMMLRSGVPLLEAIQMTRGSIANSVFRDLFNLLESEVLNGRGIGEALAKTQYIPGGASRMVVTAERTGRLGIAMEKVGTFYEAEGQRRLHELSKLLEPAIIIIMGALVGGIVLSVMLPMFSLTQMARMH